MENQLRFRNNEGQPFPDWEPYQLSDVADSFKYGLNAAAIEYDGTHKYIRITDINEDGLYDGNSPVSPSGELPDDYIVQENDILLARTGASVGKSYLYNTNDGLMYYAGFLIRAHIANANAYFIFSHLQTENYWTWVKRTSVRSGQPGINATEYGEYPLNIPSIEEQDKIADFLRTFNDLIKNQKQTIRIVEDFKRGSIQKILAQEIRFSQDNEESFPDWNPVALSDVAELVKKKIKLDGDTVYISTENMVSNFGGFILSGNQSELVSSGVEVEAGDILISNIRPYLKKIEAAAYTCACSTDVLCLRAKPENRDFLLTVLRTQSFIDYMMSTSKGTKMPRGDKNSIMAYELYLPSADEQRKINEFLAVFTEKIEIEKKILSILNDMKKGFLQQMFV